MDAVYITRNTEFISFGGPKTVLKLITPSSFGIKIHEIGVSLAGISTGVVPATLEWGTSDETSAGVNIGTAVTTQIKGRAQAHGLTVGQNMVIEGTVYTVHNSVFVRDYNGVFVLQTPLVLEPASPTDAANSFFLMITTNAGGTNVLAYVKWSRG